MNLLYQKLAPHCALQVRPSRDRSGEELTPRALNRAADPLVTAGPWVQTEVVEYSQLPGGCMADGDCARDAMIILGVANAVDG